MEIMNIHTSVCTLFVRSFKNFFKITEFSVIRLVQKILLFLPFLPFFFFNDKNSNCFCTNLTENLAWLC